MRKIHKFTAGLGSLGLLGGLALAAGGPAMAACPGCTGGGTVPATVTVPATFAFTLTAQSVAFGTLSPGSGSAAQPVSYSVTTNDASGYSVTVKPSGDMAGTGSNAAKIPSGDVAVWGEAEYSQTATNPSPIVGSYNVSPLSNTTAVLVASSTQTSMGSANTTASDGFTVDAGHTPGAADTWRDWYAFLAGSGYTEQGGTNPPWAGVPAVPADTYTSTLNYTAAGS